MNNDKYLHEVKLDKPIISNNTDAQTEPLFFDTVSKALEWAMSHPEKKLNQGVIVLALDSDDKPHSSKETS